MKVITKNSYKWWGLLSNIILFGIPIIYIMIKYEIFKKSNIQFTAWGWVIIIIVIAFLKKFITQFILDMRDNLSLVEKRVVLITSLIILAIVLLLYSFWITDIIFIVFAFVLSLSFSLFPYYKYMKNKTRYDNLKKKQQSISDKKELESGNLIVK